MHPYVMYITGLVVVLCLCQMLLHHYKVIKTHLQPKRTRRSRFPPHVRLRGFGSADYQERGGYGGDAIVNGKLTHVKGTMTDWSWDAADRELPPPWAKGSLPLLFDRGNRSDAYFEEDMQAMKDCSATMNRFSVSWAKLQPNGSSSCLDVDEVRYIEQRICKIRQKGMTPMITLLHFVTPQWFAGWNATGEAEFRSFVASLAKVVPSCADSDGNEWWISINEPNIQMLHGHILGTRPPGDMSLARGISAYASLLRCHVIAAEELRRIRRQVNIQVSPACNILLLEPKCWWSISQCLLVFLLDTLMNRSVLALLTGKAVYVGNEIIQGESMTVVPQPPFVAVNQYTRLSVGIDSLLASVDVDHEIQPHSHALSNQLNWDVHPQYLWSVLKSVDDFCVRCVVIITEHGIPDDLDVSRCKLIEAVADVLHHTPWVCGYIHWAFADNVEWELGTMPRFGVVAVEYGHACKRTPRPSYHLLKALWR